MPDFPEPLDWLGMNATRLYTVKHGGYKQVLSVDGCKPNAMVVDRLLKSKILNRNPIGSYRLYMRDSFSYEEGRF
jgi:DNA topoisomerase-3